MGARLSRDDGLVWGMSFDMFLTTSELLKKINLGEDIFVEFKEVRFRGEKISGPKQDTLADELAAFANSRGGVLLLGINDSREVVGIAIEKLDKVEALVLQACKDSLEPSAIPIIERIYLPDSVGNEKPVLRVEVSPSLFVHKSPRGYYHRVGSSKQIIPSEQLARLFQHRSQSRLIRFDELPVSNATIDDLDEKLWQRFATPRTNDRTEQFLSKLSMATQDNKGVWRPTVAGVLLASRQPQQFIPNAYIQAVAYRGNEISAVTAGAYQLDAQDITGPLDQQIYGACDFIRKNMLVAAKKETGGRQDIPQYSEIALFEAVTNSVAHRDYSMAGSKVRLRLFYDRLELYIPGSLANTMTPDSLPYRQATRNEAISSQLARCLINVDYLVNHRSYIMDKRGEGVRIILSESEKLSGKTPKYKLIDQSELLLTIYAADCS